MALESNWLGCSASCPLRPAVRLRIRRPPPQSSTPAVKAVCRHHHQGVPCPPRASEASKPIRRRFPLLTTHGPLLRLQVKSRDFSQNIWNARIQPFLLKTASNGAFLPPPALRVRQRWMQLLLVGSEPAQECRAKPWKNSAKKKKTLIGTSQKEVALANHGGCMRVLWNE